VHQLPRGHGSAEAAADDDRVEGLHGPKLVGDGRLQQSSALPPADALDRSRGAVSRTSTAETLPACANREVRKAPEAYRFRRSPPEKPTPKLHTRYR
jgi:hypothetical protein